MNPFTSIPPTVRAILYIIYGVGSLVMFYLASKGFVGVDETTLWAGLGALFGLGAASNVVPNQPAPNDTRSSMEG